MLFSKIKSIMLSLLLLCAGGGFVSSCSDNVDESNLYSFTGNTVMSYLDARPDFSEYCKILRRVHLGPTLNPSASALSELLSARGNYTCFAPTNDAIQLYVDSIMGMPEGSHFDLAELSDSIAGQIAKNSLIDNGSSEAYRSSDFTVIGALDRANMNDRYVSINFETVGNRTITIINGVSRIVEADREVSNGYVHVVDQVITSSLSTLPSLMEVTSNMKVFSLLLRETSWADSLVKYIDEDYELDHVEGGQGEYAGRINKSPLHRKFGYTVFAEPDELMAEYLGITIDVDPVSGQLTPACEEAIITAIKAKCEDMELYQIAGAPKDDLTHPDNAVNQFVAYHLLGHDMAYNRMVSHYNELGFAYNKPEQLTINVFEYYVCMGKHRRLVKLTEGRTTQGPRINRLSTYDNDRDGTYDELTVINPGLKISATNPTGEENYALNGHYYPIDKVMVYDSYVRDQVLFERIRFDVCAPLSELMTNGIRRPQQKQYHYLPEGYLDGLTATEDTHVNYLNEWGAESWRDYMGDELCIMGQYDFVYRLPPVPRNGTYELRFGSSNNSLRGMAQVYIGTDKDNLPAVGLPMDLRLQNGDSGLTLIADDPEDQLTNMENDKSMRNLGFMRAPMTHGMTSGTGVTTPLRDVIGSNPVCRKILTTMQMDPEKTYYIRFKSVLENPLGQFFFDYFEYVPTQIIREGSEDIW